MTQGFYSSGHWALPVPIPRQAWRLQMDFNAAVGVPTFFHDYADEGDDSYETHCAFEGAAWRFV